MRLRNGRLVWMTDELVLLDRWRRTNPEDLFLRGFSASYLRSWLWLGHPLEPEFTWRRREVVDYQTGLPVLLEYYKRYLTGSSISDSVRLLSRLYSEGEFDRDVIQGPDIIKILDECQPTKCRISIVYSINRSDPDRCIWMDTQIRFRSRSELTHFALSV